MIILSIQKHHNSSVCVFDDSKLIYFNQEERLSRVKKDFGIPVRCLEQIYRSVTKKIDKVVITGYNYSSTENALIYSYLKKIGFLTTNGWYQFYKCHHLCHAANAFYNSGFNDALIFVWDGRGSTYTLTNGSQAYETTTVYTTSKNSRLNIIYKRLFTAFLGDKTQLSITNNNEFGVIDEETKFSNYTDKTIIDIRSDHDIAHFYDFVSRHLGFDIDECGKMMGLQSYGTTNNNFIPEIIDENFRTNMSLFCVNNTTKINTTMYPQLIKESQISKNLIDFSAKVQKSFEESAIYLIQKILEKTNAKKLIFTGGAALNVVANGIFLKRLDKNLEIYIEPLCGDEGNCIGAAQLYRLEFNQAIEPAYKNVYLGPIYKFNLPRPNNDFDVVDCDNEKIVEYLDQGNIVAVYQGAAEAGPRALGNRSFLFDPRVQDGKDIVNTIKKRESFRPFACSVIYEHANDWFEMEGLDESMFMLYALRVKPDKQNLIPAVVHVDGTCRIQTVKKNQNKNLYEILLNFYKKTQVPVLLNTSFNLAGEPLVETVEDALNVLKNSSLNLIYFPEFKKIIIKKSFN
jgi:carbamoyltransferase